ncbi:MAG: CCA tRNA nucleotidyltransferase [Firmicutes bacterium]|nr:CCA tRNA nucleotidyltransferase [Bacillota bacterium]
MSVISPPDYALKILKTLEDAGFAAYFVGGCVRDNLLGRRPRDWDTATSAPPEQILSIFPGSKPTGLKHGTVTVVTGGKHVEVTTFRAEGGYADHRRPDSVRFISDLTADLSRRDFTINAMALSRAGELIDPFGGQTDLKARLIRCVGEPEARFEEDALRMFRALRFSAQLGFTVEAKTAAAIKRKAHLAAFLAPERICGELEKVLLSPNPTVAAEPFSYGLMAHFTSAPGTPDAKQLRHLPNDRLLRWAGLCEALERGGLISDTAAFLAALRLDTYTVRTADTGVALALSGLPEDGANLKRLLSAYGTDAVRCAAGQRRAALSAVLDSGECWSLDCLAVKGGDLLALGYKGKALGDALGFLLERVIERPELNERETLLGMLHDL